jgi:hypothetical protein
LIIKKIILFPVLILLVLFYSCSDSPTSIGNKLLSPDYINVFNLDSFQDSLQQSSTYYKTMVKLGDSPRLLIGKFDNVEASTLLKFPIFLADSIQQAVLGSTLSIVSAKVTLTREYNIGDSTGSLNYSVHFVNNDWTALFTSDSLATLNYNSEDISSNRSYTDSLYTFDLNNETIFSWLMDASDTTVKTNKGIYIQPDPASNRIVGFDAYNVDAIGLPKLTIVVTESGYIDTLSYISFPDVSILTGDIPIVPSEDIVVQAGLGVNSRITFDLSSIPKGSVINKAQFTIYLDSSATKTAESYSNFLTAYFAKDTTTTAYDTTSGIVLNRVDNYFTGDIAKFIQSISSGYHENLGFVLAAGGQNTGVDIFALKGSSSSNLTLKPRLEITYTGRK